MTVDEIRAILLEVRYPGFAWHVRGSFEGGGAVTLQAAFVADDAVEPGTAGVQTTRKWLLSQHMVPSEIVQTALKCVLTAIEHEARENFTYRGERVFGPHFSIDELVRLCVERRTEVRP